MQEQTSFLKRLKFAEGTVLSRSELKKITGGTDLQDGRDDSPGCNSNACGPHGNGTCKTGVSVETKNCVCGGYPEANDACIP